ncbi:MAG: thioredoxin [Clostridia bacterium]|nr:thioredoxin [Clostridia bacterium]
MVKEINAEEFKALLDSKKKFVCDFFATWCGPCRMLAPVMEKVSVKHPDITFVKVDVDKNMELAAEYGIMSIPLVMAFDNGADVNKTLGFMPEDEAEEFIADSGF